MIFAIIYNISAIIRLILASPGPHSVWELLFFLFFPKALRAGFSFRFRGPGVGHAVDGCRRPCGAPKRAFRSRGSEIRLGGPGRISELQRQGLSEGPKGVSKRHLE